jgi:8-hydroxy-5-deazaflavin:NADPH oxidoreductase
MNIGIIGTGNLGIELGRLWAKQGHVVFFGSRNPDYALEVASSIGVMASGGGVAAAAKFGRVVLLAVRWDALPDVLKEAGSLRGKIVIDATNPSQPDWTALYQRDPVSGAEALARMLPGAKVVKAFNRVLVTAGRNGQTAVAYAGDDAEAKATVAGLIEAAGSSALDYGCLDNARSLETVQDTRVQPAYLIGQTGLLKITRA